MRNLEEGFEIAYYLFLNNLSPAHIRVTDALSRPNPSVEKTWRYSNISKLEEVMQFSQREIVYKDLVIPEPVMDYHGVTESEIKEFIRLVHRDASHSTASSGDSSKIKKNKRGHKLHDYSGNDNNHDGPPPKKLKNQRKKKDFPLDVNGMTMSAGDRIQKDNSNNNGNNIANEKINAKKQKRKQKTGKSKNSKITVEKDSLKSKNTQKQKKRKNK